MTLYLRQFPDRKHDLSERLRLTITDARELITALTYVCDVAEGRVAPMISPASSNDD